jgi:predicted ATPase
MKLTFKNLGAIKSGEIDMDRQFYLFVGYNNSGKTYLSKLLFTIFHDDTMQGFPNEELVRKIGEVIANNKIELTNELVKNLLDGFAKHVESKFKTALNLDKDQVSFRNFSLSFTFTEEEIINHSFAVNSHSGIKGKPYSIFSLKKTKGTKEVVYEESSLSDLLSELDEEEKAILENSISEKRNPQNINNTLILFLLRSLLRNEKEPVFFPADRVFYLKHKRSIFSEQYQRDKEVKLQIQELIEQNGNQINLKELFNLIKPNFTNAEDVLISKIVKMENKFLDDKLVALPHFTKIYQDLEKIMGGEVVLKKVNLPTGEKEIEYAFKFDINQKETDELPLALSSSAVNQLSTIYLFLKYILNDKPKFLFIDEPEENLHPQNQILLLNLLLEFANMNKNRVLIASHSPLLAEALNNYLILSQLKNKKEVTEQLGLLDLNLTTENIGIYYFHDKTIHEHKAGNYGTIFTSFKLAQDGVYQTGEELSEIMFQQLKPVLQ